MSENLPACEFRKLDGEGVYHCLAAGGASLGVEGGELVAAVCGSCSVPEALASNESCLYLIAWTDIEQERSTGKFACRFFHPLFAKPWTDNEFCKTCPYWYPRPPLSLLDDHAEWVGRMRSFYTAEGLAGYRAGRREEIGDWSPRDPRGSEC